MNLLSEIISKPVLNLYSGKIEGTISNAIFDNAFKKIQYLKIFDNEEEEYLLATNKIFSIGSSSVVIKNGSALRLQTTPTKDNNPINFEVFSANGDKLGSLQDVELENFEVVNFITETSKIAKEDILNISKIIVVNTEDKIKYCNLRPKIKKSNASNCHVIKIMPTTPNLIRQENNTLLEQNTTEVENNNFIITESNIDGTQNFAEANIANNANNTQQENATEQSNENSASNTQTINIVQPQNNNNQTNKIEVEQKPPQIVTEKQTFKISSTPSPQRIVSSGNFLIGRKVTKTIYGINNEIIIKKDNFINMKNLEIAKMHNKLVELTVYSRIKA